MRCRLAVAIVAVFASTPAHAEPTLAALAPARDARRAIAIGPTGELYAPDGKGAWVRTQAGGTAEQIVTAVAAGDTVIAAAKNAPPFRLADGVWTVVNLGGKGRPLLASGTRLIAALGTSVFALDKRPAVKLATAPRGVTTVTALGASANGIVVATNKGLMKVVGAALQPIKKAPRSVRALVSDRWALVDRGALDLKTMKTVPLPAGLQLGEVTTLGDELVGVSVRGKTVELVTIKGTKLTREPVPIDNPKAAVGVVIDKAARVAIAFRDGRIALRDKSTWTVSEVRDELGAPRPGPAPATSPQ